MNLVDSSGWLEYFADGKNAGFFAPAIENTKLLIVSSINCYEVFNRIAQRDDLNLLPGADPERRSYIAWNHYLELRRDSYRCHRFSHRSQCRITLYHRWILRTTYPATI